MKIIISFLLAILLSFSIYPIQYFFDSNINFLPLQFLVYFSILSYLFKLKLTKTAKILIGVFIIYFIILLLYNIFNPISLITNPIILTIFTILLIFIFNKSKHIKYLDLMLNIFFILFILYSLFINIENILINGIGIRFKGFGSGTLYATLSAISIIYYLEKLKYSQIKLYIFILLSLIPISSILLTQSRGSLLILILTILMLYMSSVKAFLKMIFFSIIAFSLLIIFFPEISELGLFNRMNINSYDSLEQFTSGRLKTQLFILDWFGSEMEPMNIFFGMGLNEVKYTIVSIYKLEFPHFDLLYLLYDGGIFSVVVYLFFATLLIFKSKKKYYIIIYFLSGLHTNMIVSPAFIILLYFLSENNKQRNKL